MIFGADDQLRIELWMQADKFTHGFINRVLRGSDAKKNLNRCAIILFTPALEAFTGLGIASFEGFQDRHRQELLGGGNLLMQWKITRDEPLPNRENQADDGEERQDV